MSKNTSNNLFLLITLFFFINLSCQQKQANYSELIEEAWDLYKEKKYKKSAKKYNKAFALTEKKEYSYQRYNAACSSCLSGELSYAFEHLFVLVNDFKYSKSNLLINEKNLDALKNDERWAKIIDIVKSNKTKEDSILNLHKKIKLILDTVLEEDQKYRLQAIEIVKEYGRHSEEVNVIKETINEKDSINLIKVKNILDKYGWLGRKEIGFDGNLALLLVIQHADIETQEKYLPILQEGVSNNNAQASDLAMLEDRIAIRNGKKQIYGTQLTIDTITGKYYPLPIEDSVNVDKRRHEVGLPKLDEYLKAMLQ